MAFPILLLLVGKRKIDISSCHFLQSKERTPKFTWFFSVFVAIEGCSSLVRTILYKLSRPRLRTKRRSSVANGSDNMRMVFRTCFIF